MGAVFSEEPHHRSQRSRLSPSSSFSVELVGLWLVPGRPDPAVTFLAVEVLCQGDLPGDQLDFVVSEVLTLHHHPFSARPPWLSSSPLSASFVSPCLSRPRTQFLTRWHYSGATYYCSRLVVKTLNTSSMEPGKDPKFNLEQ